MIKSSLLNAISGRTSVKNSSFRIISLVLLTVIPLVLFLIFQFFSTEISSVIMTLYPPTHGQSFAFYKDLVGLTSVEILWLGLFFLLTWLFAVYLPSRRRRLYMNISSNRFMPVMLILSVFFITTLVISFYTLQQFANSSDEYAYVFQAEMFSNGRFWYKAHDLPDFFYSQNIAQHEGLRLSRFPPGWPLLLSVAFVTGFPPFLVNPVLGLIMLIIFYFFARRYYGEQVAIWSAAALAFSGFYIFNAASYFSHISCALVTLLFVYHVYLYNEKQNLLYGLLAGFFLSLVVIIRYYTAVIIFVPFVLYLLYHYRLKAIYLFIWIGIGSIPCMAFLFWYNFSITGNALLPVTVWAYSEEQLGFVKGHSFLKGVEHLIRWILMFFYWSSPGLLILYVGFLWRKIKSGADRLIRPEDYTFFLLAAGYFFYYEIGGNQYGPRFLFEALPFLILFTVNKVLQTRDKWAVGLLCASLIYAVVKLPFIAYRENRIIIERLDLYKLVDQQKIRNAVIFVASQTGLIRPMPAGDLTRNDASFSNEVIYAMDKPETNHQLMEYYPDRSFYRYVRDLEEASGQLVKVK